MYSLLRSSLLLLLLLEIILSRPARQRIEINNHVWEVPDEPGWEEVVRDADIVRSLLSKCTTTAECRQIINELRAVFYHYAVSRKYLESNLNDIDDILGSVFKWG